MKILIDNGHGSDTPGKRSPDGKFLEYRYNRIIAARVVSDLVDCGYDAQLLVTEENDVSLQERVRHVNAQCDVYGVANVLLVSIHVNAAAADGKWHDATGWSAYTTPVRRIAEVIHLVSRLPEFCDDLGILFVPPAACYINLCHGECFDDYKLGNISKFTIGIDTQAYVQRIQRCRNDALRPLRRVLARGRNDRIG